MIDVPYTWVRIETKEKIIFGDVGAAQSRAVRLREGEEVH